MKLFGTLVGAARFGMAMLILIFPNHTSYLDILMLVHTLPLRFLSAIENKSMRLIGMVATAIGTVFVDRGEKASRAESRQQIGPAPGHPALVLVPEGGLGPGGTLEPSRYGAFDIAIESGKAILPGVIQNSRPDVILWDWRNGETMWAALRKLARYLGPPITAPATSLSPVIPKPGDLAALSRMTPGSRPTQPNNHADLLVLPAMR